MKTLFFSALIAAAIVATASPAPAQTRPPADAGRALFQQADVNNDGRLSRVEFDAAREGRFARADADRDGRLTMSELRALRPDGAPAPQRRPSRDQIRKLRAIDRNRDGFVTRDEIADLARAMTLGG